MTEPKDLRASDPARAIPFLLALSCGWLAMGCAGPPAPDNGSGGVEEVPAGVTPLPDLGVVTDGRFEEWADAPMLLVDPLDAPEESAVDIGAVQASADGRFIYFTLETRRPVNAQAMRGTLSLLLDTDANPGTGVTLEGLAGVDLVVELSRKDRIDTGGYGSGMAVREAEAEGVLAGAENGSVRDLLVSPTHSADRFEVRLSRARKDGLGRSELRGHGARVAFLFESEGEAVDWTEPATLRLPPLTEASDRRWSEPLEPTGDVRVLSWNVSSESFERQPARFARVMAALDPDVLLLDEVYGAVTEADMRAFLARPEFGSGRPWDFVLGTSGGRQKTVVASRMGVRPEPALDSLPYPAGSLEALTLRFPDQRSLFEMERDRGLASVGAWVEVEGKQVLFVPVDLQSAGYDGSFQDELRILQARTLRDHVAEALDSSDSRGALGAALVIGGDLNLVGSPVPLGILSDGLDRGSDLVVVDTYRLTDRSMATWRDESAPFSPGRLDFVLVSGSALTVQKAFAFEASELSEELLGRLGIRPEDSDRTSDHLPLVVDLSVRERFP